MKKHRTWRVNGKHVVTKATYCELEGITLQGLEYRIKNKLVDTIKIGVSNLVVIRKQSYQDRLIDGMVKK